MGIAADRCGIQFRLLNRSKGPAVRAPRAQQDKIHYKGEMLRLLEDQPCLEIAEEEVTAIEVDGDQIAGLVTTAGSLATGAVVLTSGTFLNGLIHVGERKFSAGRMGEDACLCLSDSLRAIGLALGRLKTGTPPRLRQDSIDFSTFDVQPGDPEPTPFSFLTDRVEVKQVPCYLGYTNARTHDLIKANLDRSPLYSGRITGIGPRYCPSIEDKVVKFPHKPRHQIFLEPEERDGESIYANGISTSMPEDVQLAMVRTIAGLERVEFLRPGYAIEYDFVKPTQLRVTLECKEIQGLFCAGQINGTSGYEEAAGQGLVAGTNAALKVLGREAMVLGRDRSYIGVMIDDLITKGVDEPYRMFTSRAENRLQLRADNADRRLTPIGRENGLIDDRRWLHHMEKKGRMERARDVLNDTKVSSAAGARSLGLHLRGEVNRPSSLLELLRRPETALDQLAGAMPEVEALSAEDRLSLETDVKYEGYIHRQQVLNARMRSREADRLPEDIDYGRIPGLTKEASQRLAAVRPETIGQASRIPGVTPASVAALAIELARFRRGMK